MNRLTKIIFVVGFFMQLINSKTYSQSIPYLRKKGTTQELVVDGKPFLVLGGELGNSTPSSLDYMRPFWSKFKAMNLNTILSPVYWELTEPEEGRFDFALVDSMIKASREHDLKLILLWFGSWKNSMSCYAPAWVKTNQKSFPRAEDHTGKGPFAVNNESNISAGILQAIEGKYVNDEWIAGRRMNGDQDHQGRHIRIPVGDWGIQEVSLYQYK